MSLMLRYVKHMKRFNGVGWRVILNQPQTKVTGVKLEFRQAHPNHFNLTKSYATSTAIKTEIPIYGSGSSFQEFEAEVRRSGRAIKKDVEKILHEVQNGETISSLESLLLIRSCGRLLIETDDKESIQLVTKVWNTLTQLNIPMDVSHYNTLLNVYLDKDHKFSPSEFISKMLDKSIKPNRVTYQKLIAAYCQQGDIAGATKILEVMRQNDMPLCENVFNSLIIGHSEANDMESAVGILKTMEDSGLQLTENTYEALLHAHAKHGDINAIKETLKKAEKSEIVLTNMQLMEVVYTLASNGHVIVAEEFAKTSIHDVLSDVEVSRILTKLINIKQIPLSMTLLKLSSGDMARQTIRGLSIIRTAARNENSSVDDLIKICKTLDDQGHSRTFQMALYHALTSHANPKIIIPLLKAWSENGGEIRVHYFWPLLRAKATENNYDEMMNIIKCMIDEFNITPSVDTLRDYVLPYMLGTWQVVIPKLEGLNIPKRDICFAIVERQLVDKRLKNSGIVMNSFPMKYPSELFLHLLVNALLIRNDVKAFLIAVRMLDREPTIENDETPVKLIDDALMEVINVVPHYRSGLVIDLLTELMNTGMSISPKVSDEVKTFLNDSITPEIVDMLDKMSSGTLKQIPLSEYNTYGPLNMDNTMPSVDLIELRRKFADCLERQDATGMINVLKTMEMAGYSSISVLAQAINFFSETGHLEAAEDCMNKVKSIEGSKLDHQKLIKYATLLVKNDRFDDAMKFISEQPDPGNAEKLSRSLSFAIRDLFDVLVANKNVEQVNQMFNILKTKNILEVNSRSLNPLVRVHLERDDLESALVAFENISNEYKITTYKNMLAKRFIENEDASSLQKLTDLCTDIHGEGNSLIELAFSFLECNRPQQARKILETSKIQIHNEKITLEFERLYKFQKFDELEKLGNLLKEVTRIDHCHLYKTLLDVYAKTNEWEKGLGLWTEMQDNDIQPSKDFIGKLGDLLARNNQEIPFIRDDINKVRRPPAQVVTPNVSGRREFSGETQFKIALSQKDYNLAEKIIQSHPRKRFELILMHKQVLKTLIDQNEIDEAFAYAKKMLTLFGNIPRTTFMDLAELLINEKRYDDFYQLGNSINVELKRALNFYKLESQLLINKNGLKAFIESLDEKKFVNTGRSVESYIHFGAMTHALLVDPTFVPKFREWADQMAKNGIARPQQVLWNYYFIKDSLEAEDLWHKLISENSSPLVRPIIQHAKQNKDVAMIQRLYEKLRSVSSLSSNVRFKTISALIEVYNDLERYDDALKIVNDVIAQSKFKSISRKVLIDLKNGLERNGRVCPYTISEDSTNRNHDEEQYSHSTLARL